MVISHDECYYLGYLSKKQGFKGGMIAFLDVDSPENYADLDMVLVELNAVLTPFFVETLELKDKNFVFLRFEGVGTASQIDELVGNALYLPLSKLPALGADEYYLHELPGMEVIDEKAGSLGPVDTVFDYSNNPLIRVWMDKTEVLIPLNDVFVKRVDKAKKRIHVDLPEGLLDVNAP